MASQQLRNGNRSSPRRLEKKCCEDYAADGVDELPSSVKVAVESREGDQNTASYNASVVRNKMMTRVVCICPDYYN